MSTRAPAGQTRPGTPPASAGVAGPSVAPQDAAAAVAAVSTASRRRRRPAPRELAIAGAFFTESNLVISMWGEMRLDRHVESRTWSFGNSIGAEWTGQVTCRKLGSY